MFCLHLLSCDVPQIFALRVLFTYTCLRCTSDILHMYVILKFIVIPLLSLHFLQIFTNYIFYSVIVNTKVSHLHADIPVMILARLLQPISSVDFSVILTVMKVYILFEVMVFMSSFSS